MRENAIFVGLYKQQRRNPPIVFARADIIKRCCINKSNMTKISPPEKPHQEEAIRGRCMNLENIAGFSYILARKSILKNNV